MIEATSCGGVVIFRGKILLLYKNYRNKYEGWVLPKGTVEEGEEYKETALREVLEAPDSSLSTNNISYYPTGCSFSVPDIRCKPAPESAFHWQISADGRPHDIYKNLSLQKTPLFVVCCNNCPPS